MTRAQKRLRASASYLMPRYPRLQVRSPEPERIWVAVTGSPTGLTLESYRWFYKMMDRVTFAFHDPIIQTYGHSSKLIDKFAMDYATSNWYTMYVYYPEESKYKIPRDALAAKNREIVEETDFLIVFTDGSCKFTEDMIRYARASIPKVKVFKL